MRRDAFALAAWCDGLMEEITEASRCIISESGFKRCEGAAEVVWRTDPDDDSCPILDDDVQGTRWVASWGWCCWANGPSTVPRWPR